MRVIPGAAVMLAAVLSGCTLPENQMIFANSSGVGVHVAMVDAKPQEASFAAYRKDLLACPVDTAGPQPMMSSFVGGMAAETNFTSFRCRCATATGQAAFNFIAERAKKVEVTNTTAVPLTATPGGPVEIRAVTTTAGLPETFGTILGEINE